ncbi:hypothetical protein C9374_003711 [Naegleria lovaniensis]|uniref:Calpain catalytic domain-containing protein n=1 Tax=Naegleria lovaniensis TaxID=51637 RepID=A0AA88H830_NAELO|nr:uncharacterized protein C9374_003711 [Naegleria lovaniensis]KAG2393947.1 hypothetical protein C9374_003711 [Naegleria lovaniensis]
MSKTPSQTSRKTGKGGKKNEKVEVTLLSDLIYSNNENMEKMFPEWDEEVLKALMERDKQLYGEEGTNAKRPTTNNANKKKESSLDEILKNVHAVDSNKISFDVVTCTDFTKNVKEWKSLKSKWEPRMSRDLFPSHPYFGRFYKMKEDAQKQVVEPVDKKKQPQKKVAEEPEVVSFTPITLESSDEEELIIEDFEKYTQVLDISNKGQWTKAFVSALYHIEECKEYIPFGSYLWERIWPKKENSQLPTVSSWGRYYLKLFFKGKDRIVIVDDKLPHDISGKNLFPISPYDEFWPSILLKGIIAISVGNEHLAFSNPLWCFSALFSNFGSQSLCCTNSLDIISPITCSLKSCQEWKNSFDLVKFLCNTPIDGDNTKKKILLLTCRKDLDVESYGLRKDNLYRVEDVKVYKGETILKVVSNDVSWNGKYSYKNASVWNAYFEEELGFCYQDRRIQKRMKDFWVEITDLQNYFDGVHILHEISNFSVRASLGSHATQISPIVFYITETTKLFIRVLGEKQSSPRIVVKKASNWKKLTPSKVIHEFSICSYDSIIPLTLPCKDDFDIYEIRFSNIENQYIEFLSEKNLVFGKQEDIYSTKLSQSIQRTDTLISPPHEMEEWKIWNIQHFNIDKEGVFSARLLVDDISILPFTHLVLINNENLSVVKSINGRIFPVKLLPCSHQYSLVCFACPNRSLESTKYTLETISENDVFDLEAAKSLTCYPVSIKGRYYTNPERELFRFRVDVGEKANICFRLKLSEATPVKVIVNKVENFENSVSILEFENFESESVITVPNLVVYPSSKMQSISYNIVCTIDEKKALEILSNRVSVAENEFLQYLKEKSETTSLQELNADESKSTDLKSPKKNDKNAKKPASAVKKPVTNQKAKKDQARIPSKQDKPQVLSSQYIEGTENSSVSCLTYSLDIFSTTPNVIYEEVNVKKQAIDQLVEEWESNSPQHGENGLVAREKFIKQRLKQLLSATDNSPRAELQAQSNNETETERKDRLAREKQQNATKIKQLRELRDNEMKKLDVVVNDNVERSLQTCSSIMKEKFIETQKQVLSLKEQKLEEEKRIELERLNEEKSAKKGASGANTARKSTK